MFDTLNAYQKTAALKAAIELDIFTALHSGPATAEAIAVHAKAAPRSTRILCDFLVIIGFLTKSGDRYALTPDSALFLSRQSPAYAGGSIEFLHSREIKGAFDNLAESVRRGGTTWAGQGTVEPEHPVWVAFARHMGPLMAPAADGLVDLIPLDPKRPARVLDVSASHGMWGLAFAKKYPKAVIVGLDWPQVLEVAMANAQMLGVGDRFQPLAGNAFEVDFGTGFDVVLAPNFLHHFSPPDCVQFLKKAHASLRPGGTVAIVEFVPNPDRVTPPAAAGFSLIMLATTRDGDAYTFAEYADMLAQAGFKPPTQHGLPASLNVALLAVK